VPADTESIRALVQGYAGGFGTLDDTVKRYLRRWFVSQGGVRVAARHGRAVGRAGKAQPVQRPGRVERVHVARFVGSGVGSASGGGGGGATISPPASAAAVAVGDRPVSRYVSNPAYDVQGACYEDMLDLETAIAMPRPPVPRSLAPTMGAHNIGHVSWSDAIDGGYMDVVGGTPPPPGRLESDVLLITDGLDRQESDVSLITDLGIMPRRLSSQSEI